MAAGAPAMDETVKDGFLLFWRWKHHRPSWEALEADSLAEADLDFVWQLLEGVDAFAVLDGLEEVLVGAEAVVGPQDALGLFGRAVCML